MKLTDDQIRSIMEKHITCKTVLVTSDESNAVIESHLKEGWELANNIECGEKRKLTFRKIEKA